MNKSTAETNSHKTKKSSILLATCSSLIAAGAVLITFILPAEFNKDPLGIGQALGIMGLSESSPESAAQTLSKEAAGFHEDTVSFELLPFEFIEYKYALNQGSSLLFSWTADNIETLRPSEVSYDFHGESHESEGYEQSFSTGKAAHENAAFTAPFNGIHGWFWQNSAANTVKITLKTAGFYSATLEFRDGFVKQIDLNKKN